MKEKPYLIVMLTYDDMTVENAYEVFDSCKDSKAVVFGFKEEPLPLDEMKRIYKYMKRQGKTTGLEVVAYTKEEGLAGAKVAKECGCDFLMGTIFNEEILEFCKENDIKYMPFVGKVTKRPSVLEGEAYDMINEGNEYIKKGAFGIDLLGYRYTKDAFSLIKEVTEGVKGPVCVAGSVDSYYRLDEILEANPQSFTIGSAFFDNKFDGTFCEQINKVVSYIEEH